MKHHKLDLRWNDSDQITIYDKRSKVSSVLHLKPIPIDQSLLMKNFSLVKSEPEHPGGQGLENPEVLLGEVSAIEALDNDHILKVHDENINILPDSDSCPSSQVFSNKISIKSQPRVTLFIGFIKMVLPSRPEDYFLVVTKLSRPRKLGMNSSVLA